MNFAKILRKPYFIEHLRWLERHFEGSLFYLKNQYLVDIPA